MLCKTVDSKPSWSHGGNKFDWSIVQSLWWLYTFSWTANLFGLKGDQLTKLTKRITYPPRYQCRLPRTLTATVALSVALNWLSTTQLYVPASAGNEEPATSSLNIPPSRYNARYLSDGVGQSITCFHKGRHFWINFPFSSQLSEGNGEPMSTLHQTWAVSFSFTFKDEDASKIIDSFGSVRWQTQD